MSLLSALFGKLAPAPAEKVTEPVEYKGFIIRPAPFKTEGQFQTAGTIEREIGGVRKEHRFIRADALRRSTMRWRLRSPRRGRWSTCRASGCSEHDPEKANPGLDPGWNPVFRKDHAPPKKIRASIASRGGHCG